MASSCCRFDRNSSGAVPLGFLHRQSKAVGLDVNLMSNNAPPTLTKWPFLLGDLGLIGVAVAVIIRGPAPLSVWSGLVCLTAVAAGAWLCALPFLREYQAAVQLSERDAMATTVSQINNLEEIKDQIGTATAQWHAIQEQSIQTVAAARELRDRMKTEMAEFCSFLQRAQDAEKNHLRLEVEKLRRGERDWLQAMVHILDHIFALHNAAAKSGQPALATQVGHFQMACRDAVRRLGLVGFAPAPGDPFDGQVHQTDETGGSVVAPSRIAEVLAVGFTCRGELVRKALVKVAPSAEHEEEPEQPSLGLSDIPS